MTDGEMAERFSAYEKNHDFEGAFAFVRENQEALSRLLKAEGVRDTLKKTTEDRLVRSFLDSVEFGARPLGESLVRLEQLLSFQPMTRVLNPTWRLGVVRKLDYFYRRITVDFETKKGHQFTYAAAVDMLVRAPDDHILVIKAVDPVRYKALVEKPAEFVKAVLKSYGDMTATKLEDVCLANGFVKTGNGWKTFWDEARAALRKDPCVEIPVRRSDPIRLKLKAESYGDDWLSSFAHLTDPALILAAVNEFEAQDSFAERFEAARQTIENRLVFAITAARKVDDALYARLASKVVKLSLERPAAAEMRAYLWDRKRFVKAAAQLPAREVGSMISFLAVDDAAVRQLCAAIPDLCSAAVSEIVSQFASRAETDAEGTVTGYPCRLAVGALMKQPKAPAPLTTLLVGKYEQFRDWTELPPLITLLMHAVTLGEGRQSGETLKMQNIVRRLFGDVKWLEKMFGWLSPDEQAHFFERFQASIAWDPATHHTIAVRMVRIVPSLEAHVVKVEKKKEYAAVTSPRSFAQKKADYFKLIYEDMPANVRKIEFAKGFGDLSENAEYQYAKDEQRQLMQKQTVMQADLERVKPSEFADATFDEVMPGVSVSIETPEGEKTYHVLGEWDNDVDLGILSFKARLAQNMLGKKVGENFELPGPDGSEVAYGTIRLILPLPDSIREWMKVPEGLSL